MKRKYRIKHVIRKGESCFIPQIRLFFIWFNAQEGQECSYTVRRSTKEEAEEWIRMDIEWRRKQRDNRTVECIPFLTRGERIQNLIGK